MPTVYEQIWSRMESGKGEILFRFLVSDDYDSLFSGAAYDARLTTDIINIGTLKSDLDTAEGKQGVDELQFDIDRTACNSTTDVECFDFILQALNDEAGRYCLLYADGALAFRGVFNSKGDGEDLQWHGDQYETEPNPIRVWKLTAKNYAIVKLDRRIQDVMTYWKASTTDVNDWNQWTDDWIEENVKNRNAYHPWEQTGDEGDPDTWETFIKFGQLTNLNKLLRKLLDVVQDMDSSTTCVFEETQIPLRFFTPELVPSAAQGIYNGGWDANYLKARNTQAKVFSFGEDVSDDNSPFVSFKLADPDLKNEAGDSFYKSQKIVNLFFDIARSFGMYADMQVDEDGVTHIQILPREQITKDAEGNIKQLYIKDVESASITTEPVLFEKGKDAYIGVACAHAIDGDPKYAPYGVDRYQYDTTNEESLITQSSLRGKIGDMTPLLLSSGVTRAYLIPDVNPVSQYKKGNDFYPSKTTDHNFAKYDYTTDTVTAARTQFDRAGDMLHNSFVNFPELNSGRWGTIHRLIYGKTTERFYKMHPGQSWYQVADDEGGANYDYTAWRPIWQVSAGIGSATLYFRTLSEYVNHITERDGKYFQTEYTLTIPFLSGFRTTVDGEDSYHNLKLGSVTVLDEREYVVVGIERDFNNIETKVRLQNLERFAFSSPIPPTGDVDDEILLTSGTTPSASSTSPVRRFIADGSIIANNAVSLLPTGKVSTSYPNIDHYNKVFGIALNDAEDGEDIDVCQAGECYTPNLSIIPGYPVYLTLPDDDGINVSSVQIGPADDCYLWQRLGYAMAQHSLFVNIEQPELYWGYPS